MNFDNRNPFATVLAIVFAVISVILLTMAIGYNPSVQSLFSPKPQEKVLTGMLETFDLPPQISYSNVTSEHSAEAECELTGNSFNVGDPMLLLVTVTLPSDMENSLVFVEAKIDNAVIYEPFLGSNEIPNQCDIYTSPLNKTWIGIQTGVFETSGIVSMTIKIGYLYPFGSNSTQSDYSTNVSFPNLQIGTGQETQQQTNMNLNLSLTFFVLFFACMDIAVTFYDHSENKEKKTKREGNAEQNKHEAQGKDDGVTNNQKNQV